LTVFLLSSSVRAPLAVIPTQYSAAAVKSTYMYMNGATPLQPHFCPTAAATYARAIAAGFSGLPPTPPTGQLSQAGR